MSTTSKPKFDVRKYRPAVPADDTSARADEPLGNVTDEIYVPQSKKPAPVAFHTRLARRLPVLTAEPPKPPVIYKPAAVTFATQATQTKPVVFYDDVKLRLPVAIVKPPVPLRALTVQQTPAKEVFFLSKNPERTYNLGAGPVYNRAAWDKAMDTAEEQRQRKIKADKAMLAASAVL